MRKIWAALLAIPLLVGCKNVVEMPETRMVIVEPKSPAPSPADHVYALAYADKLRADWVADMVRENEVKVAEMTAVRDDYLTKAAMNAVDVFSWPPRTRAADQLYTFRAIGQQEDMTRDHRFVNGLGVFEAQLLMQAFAEEQAGRKIEEGSVPHPPR